MAYDIVVGDLSVRSLDATPLALGLFRSGEDDWGLGPHLLALDVRRDEFVRLPIDPSSHGEMLALAHDGRHLLVHGPNPEPHTRFGVGMYTLATGDLRFFDEGPDGSDFLASMSPDGRHVAALVLTNNPDHAPVWEDDPHSCLAAVSLIEVATGHRRRIWTGPPGGWGAESAIRWSPDGALIAVTYAKWFDEREDLYDATAIIEPDGTPIRNVEDSMIPQSNGAWLTNTELLIVDTYWETDTSENLSVIDVRTGARRTVGGTSVVLINAVLSDRVIKTDTSKSSGHHLTSYRLDGTDPQPFITLPDYTNSFDIAPTLIPATWTNP